MSSYINLQFGYNQIKSLEKRNNLPDQTLLH